MNSTRMAFSCVPVHGCFVFLGNPIVWRKTSDFNCYGVSVPSTHWTGEEPECSAIDNHFGTDSIVDMLPDFDLLQPI